MEAGGGARAGRDPRSLLESVFGFRDFRGDQLAVIERVLAGGDALVIMPTGSGKSLCYQIPAMLRDGCGIVVSPLIALMHDQVTALRQLGVRAACLHSNLADSEAAETWARLRAGRLDLLYVAPERLLTERFLELLSELPLALFAIDEAHCVSQWGHDFRPEYLDLAQLGRRFPGVPRLALTATADPPTRREIVARLELVDARQFVGGFDRPNLRYRVVPKTDARRQLLRFLRDEHPDDGGIVYCLSRKRTEETAAFLEREGFSALPYHAGLAAGIRTENQRRFVNDEVRIVVATVAFGMGIDKPDVRFVFHVDPPKSLEAYYQETGRAGRDGLPADATMTYGLADLGLLRKLIADGESAERQRVEHAKLDALLGYCETTRCRRQVLLQYFGDDHPGACGNCDTCLEPVETWDGTEPAQKLLSAVVRTGQRFGQGHVIDVLLGNAGERMRRFGHDRLPTFGAGKELDRNAWRSVVRQLVAAGFLAVDVDGYGGLRLAGDARDVLRGGRTVELRRDTLATSRARRERTAVAARTLETDAERRLFERLRAKRTELAREQGVPPYVIFADRTLVEMASARPVDLAAMRAVHGVGETKLERYGEIFLAVLREDAGQPAIG